MKPLLPGLPDGELAPEMQQAVRAHLEACEGCREEAESFRSLGRALRAASPPAGELPSGSQAVDWILRQDATRSRPWWSAAGAFRPSAALGLAMAGALVVMVARWELGPTPRTRPAASAPAPQALPALIVVDDEQTGRQVILAPDSTLPDGAGGG